MGNPTSRFELAVIQYNSNGDKIGDEIRFDQKIEVSEAHSNEDLKFKGKTLNDLVKDIFRDRPNSSVLLCAYRDENNENAVKDVQLFLSGQVFPPGGQKHMCPALLFEEPKRIIDNKFGLNLSDFDLYFQNMEDKNLRSPENKIEEENLETFYLYQQQDQDDKYNRPIKWQKKHYFFHIQLQRNKK